jgi:Zn-dependent protease with chaperone function
LSPEEEDEIAAQLAGPGWYQAIGDILSQDGSMKFVPTTDWRYAWVQETLRKLERTIPILQKEKELEPLWLETGPDDIPLPPPAEYPLRPRPRGTEYLRWFSQHLCKQTVQPVSHAIPGPPYSLVVVDRPDAANAFSYGFGPDGAGGVVVYSGFIDDILSRVRPSSDIDASASGSVQRSWWESLTGGVFSHPRPLRPIPTPEQTSELAILLAHELGHLVLSHHLETLSSGTIVVPGIISIFADVLRVLVFPVTMV